MKKRDFKEPMLRITEWPLLYFATAEVVGVEGFEINTRRFRSEVVRLPLLLKREDYEAEKPHLTMETGRPRPVERPSHALT